MISSLSEGIVMWSHDSVMLFQKKYRDWSCDNKFRLRLVHGTKEHNVIEFGSTSGPWPYEITPDGLYQYLK